MTYPDVFRMFTFSDSDHPKELVDIISRVPNDPTKYHQYIVYI
jgi:hypothetical protein